MKAEILEYNYSAS